MKTALDVLQRGVTEIFPHVPESNDPQENLAIALETTERPLRIKFGIDPTGTDVHLGHSIPIRKLRAFQDLGHTAVLIIGDFTARIGDPTGKSDVRKQLTSEDVAKNVETYLDQIRPILDFDTPGRLEIRYNSEWLSKLTLTEISELLATMTVGQMLAKEGFSERYNRENPIFLHEFLYPLMQGYDSVAVESDVEIGGTDQKFNFAVGRDLQRHFQQKPQFGLLMPILPGTDGVQKMSKSLNNYVGLKEDSVSMYSKLEKTPDAILPQYFELLTHYDLATLPDNPRECQKLLALDIVKQYWGESTALETQKSVQEMVTQGKMGDTRLIPEYSLTDISYPVKLFYLLNICGLCSSSSDARRQIKGGAVKLDGDKITEVNWEADSVEALDQKILQVGKKKFTRLIKVD